MDIRDQYIRRATLLEVIDGDTFKFRVDLGYETDRRVRIRMRDYNAADYPKDVAAEATDRARLVLGGAEAIWIQTFRREQHQDEEKRSFERYIGEVWVDGALLSALLGGFALALMKQRGLA